MVGEHAPSRSELSQQWIATYEVEASALIRFATMLVGPSAAEDVVSEAMIRVFDRSLPAEAMRAYLYRTVANTGKNHLRSLGRRSRRELRTARAEATTDADPLVSPEIAAAMASLSPQQRAVIFLTYWSDLTVGDVADHLDVSPGTVKRQLARARAKLGKALA